MDKEQVENLIKKTLGTDSYIKGKNYSANINFADSNVSKTGLSYFKFYVKSERVFTYYNVTIMMNRNQIFRYSCTCKQYQEHNTCKHIAACFLRYSADIFPKPETPYDLSKKVLAYFSNNAVKTKQVKEQLNLEVELNFEKRNIMFSIAIGLKKTYVIKSMNKLNEFINAYKKSNYTFGKNFEYDPNKHYLNEQDELILKFLCEYKKDNSSYYYYDYGNPFELNEREFKSLLGLIKGKIFKIKDYGEITQIKYEAPTELKLDYIDDIYELKFENKEEYYVLDSDYKYIVYNKTLYLVPDEISEILRISDEINLNKIVFKKDDLELFKTGLLNKIKNNIEVTENVKDIIISGKPNASYYFDIYKDSIACKLELDYKGEKIDYFSKTTNIIRDDIEEDKFVNELFNYNFYIKKDKFIIDDINDIGYFLEEGIELLSKNYNVYTSKKLDNMKILKKSNINSNFSIGKDAIMSYKFNVDNIDLSELDKVLSSLKNKQKYYKLKNGNIIDLDENKELQELNNIFDDLELNSKNLSDGKLVIPKYRAFYIDSLKKNKYKSIETNNLFDEFIKNFEEYKNVKIKFDNNDEKILRDYQKEGVKWLYTLYKCDLGGILADEMGLGKSIQTICFIKQILKEKPDSKIMIVCPTALVYNWKKEFEKFAPELKYVTVAENKKKRMEVINNINKYNIFITSYGLVRNDNDEYEKIDFEVCIIDEAQAIKNYQANMTKEVKKIKSRTKIALTGTPLENSVLELWSIFDFIMPGYLNSVLKFKENYGISEVDEESLSKLKNLNYQITPFILRRKKKDVSKELPDKVENTIYLELPDYQKALYLKVLKETEKEMNELIATEGYQKARFKILQLLMKLRQICIDPSIIYDNYEKESIKLEKLLEIVKDYIKEGHKILIFSSFKKVLNKVKTIFDKEKITNYFINGEVKSKERMELVESFNKDKTNCFLITLKSGGTGLNLTSADIVIHLDIWWNPQVENQATDRTHRIGQKNKVTVIKLITKGTIEERIIELQNKKKILSDNLIEGKANAETVSTLTERELKELLSYGEDE